MQTEQKYYACKIVPKSRLDHNNLVQRFEIEIRINQQIHHPGVVSLVDILQDINNFYVIMEFCPNGDLFQYIVDRQRLKEEEAKNLIYQIFDTIRYIHAIGVSHRDLKPENILVDQFGKMKISDFGLSKFVDKNDLVTTPCGSPCYASPECVSGKPYNGKTNDAWSCGVILFVMLTGQLPWTKRNQAQLFEQIKKGEYSIPDYVSFKAKSLIRALMMVDLKKRLTIQQAMDHEWFKPVAPVLPYDINSQMLKIVSYKKVDSFFEKFVEFDRENVIKSIEEGEKKRNVTSYFPLNFVKYSIFLRKKYVKKEISKDENIVEVSELPLFKVGTSLPPRRSARTSIDFKKKLELMDATKSQSSKLAPPNQQQNTNRQSRKGDQKLFNMSFKQTSVATTNNNNNNTNNIGNTAVNAGYKSTLRQRRSPQKTRKKSKSPVAVGNSNSEKDNETKINEVNEEKENDNNIQPANAKPRMMNSIQRALQQQQQQQQQIQTKQSNDEKEGNNDNTFKFYLKQNNNKINNEVSNIVRNRKEIVKEAASNQNERPNSKKISFTSSSVNNNNNNNNSSSVRNQSDSSSEIKTLVSGGLMLKRANYLAGGSRQDESRVKKTSVMISPSDNDANDGSIRGRKALTRKEFPSSLSSSVAQNAQTALGADRIRRRTNAENIEPGAKIAMNSGNLPTSLGEFAPQASRGTAPRGGKRDASNGRRDRPF